MNRLGFGFLRLPKDAAGEYDWQLLNEMVDYAIAHGCTYFDTCYTYLDGSSELAIRRCVSERVPRGRFQLAEKLPGYKCSTYEDCQKFFDEELQRCGVDYFDVYLLHWLNGEHYAQARATGQFRFLQELKEKGLARSTGFSYHDGAALLDRILDDHPEIDVVQLQINYLDWDTAGIESRKCYESCVRHGKKVIVMEPVKGGTLAALPAGAEAVLKRVHPDWSAADWALRFVRSLPEVEICLSGMNTMQQLTGNVRSFAPRIKDAQSTGTLSAEPCGSGQLTENGCDASPLTHEELHALETVRDILQAQVAVPCTECRYCVSHCPVNIPIPDYFKLYNELQRFPGDGWKIRPSYVQLAEQTAKASACIGCGNCEKNCPQHISVPQYIRKTADAMEKE